MKIPPLLPATLLVALLVATPLPAQNAPTRVAIANPARIFNEIQETRDLQAKFNAELQLLDQQRQERELKIRDTRTNRDQLKPDSPQWAERHQELMRLGVEFETWQRIMTMELERQQKVQMKTIFDKITEAVAEVARGKNVELVIAEVRPDLPENLDAINVNDLRTRLAQRNVLFHTATVDLSDEVIAMMDARYKAGR